MIRERAYDNAINEGGEGYNPYRAEREDAVAVDMPRSIDDVLHDLEIHDSAAMRASDANNAEKVAALRAELAALEAAEQAEFLAEWSLEVTRQRRADWNAWVRGSLSKADKRYIGRMLREQQDKQGWKQRDLNKAIEIHGL